LEDLNKASWYLNHHIEQLKKKLSELNGNSWYLLNK
jgi:two-component SAPR family response regulator